MHSRPSGRRPASSRAPELHDPLGLHVIDPTARSAMTRDSARRLSGRIKGQGARRFVAAAVALAAVFLASSASVARGQAPVEPSQQSAAPHVLRVEAVDRPNDAGTAILVRWSLSENAPADQVTALRLSRQAIRPGPEEPANPANRTSSAADAEPGFDVLSTVDVSTTEYEDASVTPGNRYRYRLELLDPQQQVSASRDSAPVEALVQWFDRSRVWFGVIVLFVCGSVMVCTARAKAGHPVTVRPIAGLQAIDEAVGRATEMGRPVLFVPGIMDLDQIETVAGLTVMSHVAEKSAAYDTPVEFPAPRVLVMAAAKEMYEAAALKARRPEAYDSDRVYYVTDDQFGYVAHVCGWMVRHEPAACFYLGKFFAESLIFAETGRSVGAIQIAGTAETAQLPFFIAACDYTLIGEELFAASAYLSGEPQQLGTVQGQDWGKFLAIGLLLTGSVLATAATLAPNAPFLPSALRYLKTSILSTGGGR